MTEKDKNRWRKRYEDGWLPWDTGRPDFNLIHMVEQLPVAPCKALDIGCGTGSNALWLVEQGFAVTGVDIAELAIEKARGKALQAGLQCRLLAGDFMAGAVPGGPFEFAFDRGCFHSFDTDAERTHFAEAVARHLIPGGLWLSIIGCEDAPPREVGPPRQTAKNVVDAVEPFFEIRSIVAGEFDSDSPVPPPGWICLMRRRASIESVSI